MQDQNRELDIIVQPGECEFSKQPNSRLITYGLESCIAIAVHAPSKEVAALLRFSSPSSTAGLGKQRSWACADTAIPALFARFRELGALDHELSIYAVGGSVGGQGAVPASGKSNCLAMRKILWRQGLSLRGEDLGGTGSRSIWFETATGRMIVRVEANHTRVVTNQKRRGDQLCRSAS